MFLTKIIRKFLKIDKKVGFKYISLEFDMFNLLCEVCKFICNIISINQTKQAIQSIYVLMTYFYSNNLLFVLILVCQFHNIFSNKTFINVFGIFK